VTPEQVQAVIAEARSWLGTPYVHMGRLKGIGVDCAQLMILVYSAAGVVADYVPENYTHDWYMHRSEELYLGHLLQHAQQVETPEPGDIAAYKFGRTVSHAGIIVEPGYLIHAYRPHGAVDLMEMRTMEDRFHSYWRVAA
jgi:cell wall-associated NlpC family hydrolase